MLTILILCAILLICCGGVASQSWEDVTDVFESFNRISDGTIMVGINSISSPVYLYNKGSTNENTEFMIASASKLVTSTTVLRVVEAGFLSLDDHPGDYIPWYTTDPSDPRSNVTLKQLLSFTSGFETDFPNCNVNPSSRFEQCLIDTYNANPMVYPPSGSTYNYENFNMDLAGTMAQYAVGADSFQEVYEEYVAIPLSISGVYNWPSAINGDLGGGMTISTADYYRLLTGLWDYSLLPTYGVLQESDVSGNDVVYESRPVGTAWDFHYGLGSWRECFKDEWDNECANHISLSSLGANGFYPLIDRKGYFLVLGTSASGLLDTTFDLILEIRPIIESILNITAL